MSSIFEKLIGRSRVVRFAFTISVSTSENRENKINAIAFSIRELFIRKKVLNLNQGRN